MCALDVSYKEKGFLEKGAEFIGGLLLSEGITFTKNTGITYRELADALVSDGDYFSHYRNIMKEPMGLAIEQGTLIVLSGSPKNRSAFDEWGTEVILTVNDTGMSFDTIKGISQYGAPDKIVPGKIINDIKEYVRLSGKNPKQVEDGRAILLRSLKTDMLGREIITHLKGDPAIREVMDNDNFCISQENLGLISDYIKRIKTAKEVVGKYGMAELGKALEFNPPEDLTTAMLTNNDVKEYAIKTNNRITLKKAFDQDPKGMILYSTTESAPAAGDAMPGNNLAKISSAKSGCSYYVGCRA